MAAPGKGTGVELGFIEEGAECYLRSDYFPSKVGGMPAWLVLEDLPSADQLECKVCGKQCMFLLQVYAPFTDKEKCFHRTLFVFVCKNPECCKKNDSSNLLVFRSQLPKNNIYYSEEPPSEKYNPTVDHPNAHKYQEMCIVCGCAGPKRCSRCHMAAYCSKHHQVLDWKAGHKQQCASKENTDSSKTDGGKAKNDAVKSCAEILFPELEIGTESEDYDSTDGDGEKSEAEKMKEYEEIVKKTEGLTKEGDKSIDKDLAGMARHETESDKVFSAFQKRIKHEPEQVLRYQRNGVALWVSNECMPTESDIPKCEDCGAERKFEFQILPQLLIHLKVDSLGASIDWGTLAVYTCGNSCDSTEKRYHREFVWKQDFSEAQI